MVLSCDEDHDGCNNGANEEGKIDLDIGEENEPFVSRAFLPIRLSIQHSQHSQLDVLLAACTRQQNESYRQL